MLSGTGIISNDDVEEYIITDEGPTSGSLVAFDFKKVRCD